MRRLAVVICTLALLPVVPADAPAAPTAPAPAKKKKCKKGYERKRVKAGKRRVVKCVKKKRKSAGGTVPGTGTNPGGTAPGAGTPGGTTPATGTPRPPDGMTPDQQAATWRSLVAGSSFTYSTYSATTGGSSKTVFSFCGDGASFRYYYEFVGQVYNEAKQRQGTYTLTKTEAGTDAGGPWVDGLISYESTIEEKPSGQAVVRVYPNSPSKAYINSGDGVTEYTRQAGAAGC